MTADSAHMLKNTHYEDNINANRVFCKEIENSDKNKTFKEYIDVWQTISLEKNEAR